MKKVTVIGLGYVGFPLLCAIAKSKKYDCWGFDIDESKLESIDNGICPIEDAQAEKDIKEISIQVTSNPKEIDSSDIYIICVPTPVDENNYPILTPIQKASETIATGLSHGNIVIIESTINPGVSEEIVLPILESSGMIGGKDFELAHCPERISPGDTEWNVYNIARNVGALSKSGCKNIADFYRSFLHAEVNEMATIQEAEATKIVENTFRDINIAYVNELAKSFDKLGINLSNVIQGASNKPFAYMAHYPGCGVGGHCIAVDPYYLIEKAKSVGFDHKFLRVAREINNSMPEYTVDKLIKMLNNKNKSIKGTSIALLGLSYKRNVGDIRESPALEIKKILKEEYSAKLNIFDPYFPTLNTYKTLTETIENSEAIVIAANHQIFVDHDYSGYQNIEVIVDGRNCLSNKKLHKNTSYTGIGQ